MKRAGAEVNRLRAADRAVHDWYRFVLSYPPHLVRTYVERFELTPADCALDPFCGTGTTLVECKKLGIPSVGFERNPMAFLACRAKLDWAIAPLELIQCARAIADFAAQRLRADGIYDEAAAPLFKAPAPTRRVELRSLPEAAAALLVKGSISPLPLHKALVLRDAIADAGSPRLEAHLELAFADTVVNHASNLQFGPEVGAGAAKDDAPVLGPWLDAVRQIATDLEELREGTPAAVYLADARMPPDAIAPESISAVITSPPYPNEKDYTRTTRLESVLLGLINNKAELQALKRELVRSNTRSVYSADTDDQAVAAHVEVNRIAEAIEHRRIELGKTSGFERMYARVTQLYFGGMARHLAGLRRVLRPGARLAYVVGDQASYLRIMIRTGAILADLARGLGYEVEGIDLFRTRLATATRAMLREEVVVLRWPGAAAALKPAV